VSTVPPILVCFRNDLRLEDHPALHAAAATGRPVIPVYLYCPESEGRWAPGGATRWYLHHALRIFQEQLEQLGSTLILRSGPEALPLLQQLMEETGATEVYWIRRFDPHTRDQDTAVKKALSLTSFSASLLREPHEVQNLSGGFYKVFTPFYKKQLSLGDPEAPLAAPKQLQAPEQWPRSEALEDWSLLPQISWDSGFYEFWPQTAANVEDWVDRFLAERVGDYKDERDFPAEPGTSRLSAALHFGQVSSRSLWHEAQSRGAALGGLVGTEAWTRQLVWRDFAHHLLYHQPHLDWHPMQEHFADFPWKENDEWLRRWQQGETGYPIVDAAMRELWTTGWMHNRCRMIVASFLVKDLLLPWQQGALWFWDTLVDADLANNSFGWQWAAGCGADAAPYFRIFNPILQSKKFDAQGEYIRHWIPELKGLSPKQIHAPWEAPLPPRNYPAPIVDHKMARDAALEALGTLKK